MRVTELIGDEYKNWHYGDVVLIPAQTGAGKTTFVLEKLLPHVDKEGKKLLYLVNRITLKEQIIEKVRGLEVEGKLTPSQANCIDVDTYQSLEMSIKNFYSISLSKSGIEQVDSAYEESMKKFLYKHVIVADECHYFSADARFNTNTYLSYHWIMNCTHSIVLFMSATIEMVEERIKSDYAKRSRSHSFYYGFTSEGSETSSTGIVHFEKFRDNYQSFMKKQRENRVVRVDMINKTAKKPEPQLRIYESGDVDYSYVKPELLYGEEGLIEQIIKNQSEKWIIFMDSKDRGKELEKRISGITGDKGCIFISADNREEPDKAAVVGQISEKEWADTQVLITTAVLDNGVSFNDIDLRNIVISADMRDTFLQMLGRKRPDGKNVRLYIMVIPDKTLIARYHDYDIEHKYIDSFNRQIQSFENNLKRFQLKVDQRPQDVSLGITCHRDFYGARCSEAKTNAWEGFDTSENTLVHRMQGRLFESGNECVRKFFYNRGGVLLMNPFSIERLYALLRFYKALVEPNGDKASYKSGLELAKKQMAWLGIDETMIAEIVAESSKTVAEGALKRVRNVLESIVDKSIQVRKERKTDSSAYKNAVGITFYDDLKTLIDIYRDEDGYDQRLGTVTRKEALTVAFIDYLNDRFALPYKQTIADGVYVLRRREAD